MEQKAIRPLQKYRAVNYAYYQRSDWQYCNQTSPDGQRYLFQFHSFANINYSLIDTFLSFFSSIFQSSPKNEKNETVGKQQNLNAVFRYMIALYLVQDKYISKYTATLDNVNTYLQILGRFNNQHQKKDCEQEEEKKLIKELIKELTIKFIDKTSKEIQNQMKKYNGNITIQTVRKFKCKLMKKCLEYILSLPAETQNDRCKRAVYIPKQFENNCKPYLVRLLRTISNIQFTKKKYRLYKLQHFSKVYKTYLQPELRYRFLKKKQQKKKADSYPFGLTLKRYTLIQNVKNYHQAEVLISLKNLYQLKKQQGQNKSEYIEMMRQLGRQLREHHNQTGQYYPFLHPKNIIFNQISLKTHLSNEMPSLSALGLLKMPMTTEQMVCFAATPQIFDLFSAPNEHLPFCKSQQGTPEQIFYDNHYGLNQLIQEYGDSHQKKYLMIQQVNNGKKLSEIRRKNFSMSEAWRFIMIFSYLINNKYYCKKNTAQTLTYEHFIQFLKQQSVKLRNNPTQLAKSALSQNKIFKRIKLNESEQMSLQIFDDFLLEREEQSSNSPNRFYKINRFLTHKRDLKKYIQQKMIGQKVKCPISNPIKYMFLFYLTIFQSYYHIYILSNYFIASDKVGLEIFKQIRDKLGITKFGEVQDRKSWIQLSFKKLQEYKGDKSKKGKKLAQVMAKYQQMHSEISDQRSNYLRLKNHIRVIIQQIEKEPNCYKFTQIVKQIRPNLYKTQGYIKTIVSNEIAKQQKYKMFNYQLQIKIRLFLVMTQDNFIDIDSIIFPLLNFEKSNNIVEEQSQQLREKYDYILSIIKEYEQQFEAEIKTVALR